MTEVSINAKVECTDGPCGRCVTIIVDPVQEMLTHLVIEDDKLDPPTPRLVAVDKISKSSSAMIRLACTREELSAMEPFTETQFIESTMPSYEYTGDARVMEMPYVVPDEAVYTQIEIERIPPGELAITRGTLVEATDGFLGRVGELMIDPESGHITHLVLEEGHLWGKRDIMLPLSAIDRATEETVYLKLNKKDVASLPAIPVRRHRGSLSAGKQIELVARIFDNPDQASEALQFLKDVQAQQRGYLKIVNAAVLVKDADSKIAVKETADVNAKQGRLFGAIAGGLIGLVAGPAGVVVGALAGAGTGGIAASKIDMGLPDEFLQAFQERLQPNTSALVVLVEDEWKNTLSEAMSDMEGVILHQTLTDEMVQKFLKANQS